MLFALPLINSLVYVDDEGRGRLISLRDDVNEGFYRELKGVCSAS